jgi:hypothetical protein
MKVKVVLKPHKIKVEKEKSKPKHGIRLMFAFNVALPKKKMFSAHCLLNPRKGRMI